MAHKLTRCLHDGKIANLIDYVIVNQRQAESKQDTRVYRSVVIDLKSKYHHLVVSRVNLKPKFRKGYYLLGIYDRFMIVGRVQDENLRETFQEQLNNFRKTICEFADGVLEKKVRTAARNISKKALCLIVRRRGMYVNCLCDRSNENKKM